jgi:mono/diheme cytochrome c family protein
MIRVSPHQYGVGISILIACAFLAGARQAPVHETTPSQPDGAALFRTYCASCHGSSGRGDGPVATFLKIPPADLTQIAKRAHGAFPAAEMIRIIDGRQVVRAHGDSKMPVWGDIFSPSLTHENDATVRLKIEALVKYLQSIQERHAGIPGSTRDVPAFAQ